MKSKYFIVGTLLVAASTLLWNSASLQILLNPKEYWSGEINKFKKDISYDQAMIKDSKIEIKIIKLTAKLRIAQEVNFSEFDGFDRPEAANTARQDIREEINMLKEDIEFWDEQLEIDQSELLKAKSAYTDATQDNTNK